MAEADQGKKEMFGFRADKPLAEAIKEFAEENELSKSDALKQLVREGLEAERIKEDMSEMQEEMQALQARVEQIEEEDGFLSWFR